MEIIAPYRVSQRQNHFTSHQQGEIKKLNKEGKTIIMVTHEPEIAAYAKRQIVIRDGIISSDSGQVEKGEN